jgi:hypothetical protein
MALMLRMLGIPSRVATGFSPGGRDPDRSNYLVDDTDAHNWVEIYFPGIGWATFDPTPPAAPAATQLDDNTLTVPEPSPTGDKPSVQGTSNLRGGDVPQPKAQVGASLDRGGGSSGPGAAGVLGAGAGAVAIGLLGAYLFRARRRARLRPDELAERELRELDRALTRVGSPLPPGTTLRGAQELLDRFAGPAAAGYAASLEDRRYRDPSLAPPGVAERRALRRALLRAMGPRFVLRVLLAVPPGGPAIGRRGRAGRTTSRSARPQGPASAGASAARG